MLLQLDDLSISKKYLELWFLSTNHLIFITSGLPLVNVPVLSKIILLGFKDKIPPL